MNQQLIEQYVAGRLDEAQAESFEEYCLAHPDVARQVEYEQRLKAGMAEVARGSTAEFVREESFGQWKLAAAASFLLFVAATAFLWQRLPGAHPHILAAVTTEEQRSGVSMRLALVRGAENISALPSGLVRMEIVGLFDTGVHYSVELDRLQAKQGADTIATLYGQHPSSPVTLEVMIDGDQLEPGTYSLRVRKQASDEEPLNFTFVKS